MRANQELIAVLQKALDLLESGEFDYEWGDPSCCNCGLIATVACGLTPDELYSEIDAAGLITNPWSVLQSYYDWDDEGKCALTALPLNDVFVTLQSLGFEPQDLVKLEYLSDPRLNKESSHYKSKQSLAQYLRLIIGDLQQAMVISRQSQIIGHKYQERAIVVKQALF